MISARTSQSSVELSQDGINRRNTVIGNDEKSYTHGEFISIKDTDSAKIPKKARPQTSKPVNKKQERAQRKREKEVEKLFSIFLRKIVKIGEANVGRKGNVGKDLFIKYLDKMPKQANIYETLKRSLVNKIVNERIYQMEKLKELFEETKNKNKGLNQERLRKMWDEIMNDLNA